MGHYITQEDLEKRVTRESLIGWTDDDHTREVDAENLNAAIRFFLNISKGTVSLGADTPGPKTTSHTVDIKSSPRTFTDESLKGY